MTLSANWRITAALSRRDAAEALGVSVYKIDRMRRSGSIREIDVEGDIRIPTKEVLRIVGELEIPEVPELSPRLEAIVDEALERAEE